MTGGDVVMQFFGAMQSGNMEAAEGLVQEDFIMEWPQSGELRDGKVARATGYWGAPFPAQDARARFAERG